MRTNSFLIPYKGQFYPLARLVGLTEISLYRGVDNVKTVSLELAIDRRPIFPGADIPAHTHMYTCGAPCRLPPESGASPPCDSRALTRADPAQQHAVYSGRC
ncbi:hypothetical protein Bbelb_090820 [Branchiostoma belcheri]|nr:hypothetical protein Bbelb_090820 [Branchiostoma belcheri]